MVETDLKPGVAGNPEAESSTPDSRGEPESGDTKRSTRRPPPRKESRCRFCRDRVKRVDYKDILTLQAL